MLFPCLLSLNPFNSRSSFSTHLRDWETEAWRRERPAQVHTAAERHSRLRSGALRLENVGALRAALWLCTPFSLGTTHSGGRRVDL